MNSENKSSHKKLVADWQTLIRTFIRPESDSSKLALLKYMEQILFGLHDFLKEHVGITEAVGLKELSDRFKNSLIAETPEKNLEHVIKDLIEDIAPHAVNVASPYFIGHMTSAIPFFMVHLKTIVAALNQNVVKLETSKVVSIIEKQVMAKIHRLIYRKRESFYDEHVQNTRTALGSFAEDGTLANITALWVARNNLFSPKDGFAGVEKDGIQAAYHAYGVERCVILVSQLGHYSLQKAAGVLGIGNRNVIAIKVDKENRMDIDRLVKTINAIKTNETKTRILAIVGIAGTTETGNIDPLSRLSQICSENRIHFHVDAAWGGPTLMSRQYGHLLSGIEMADSVTIDGHKQFYMPMSAGMVIFKDPTALDSIVYHANYVNRPGSVDLGIKSISGSREANSLILDAALKIMGSQGYALLIEHGIETARAFADEIRSRPDFELVTAPVLNILTYRVFPFPMKSQFSQENPLKKKEIIAKLNKINRTVQRLQREAGKSFVSRTTLKFDGSHEEEMVVLRCVIMNPLTTLATLGEILDEQEEIYRTTFLDGMLSM
ncbi:MAG: putative pyridoxal-dependent aspartate 1-decarboxylase [Desulfobacterales bacterium]|nr:putative pyridoxal-dependent aspartate 1-decarboxylase [Desulfobacterales bacterium]